MLISVRDNFGSEGWGFKSLQARHLIIIINIARTMNGKSAAQAN